jgi:putative ABC transport system ATP-binding protein
VTAEPSTETGVVVPVAHLRDVTRLYRMGDEEVHALDGVTFDVLPGEYWSIMGASGSGKSTLLNVMGCLDRPTSGTYKLGGEDVDTLSDDDLSDLRSRRLGFIFQSYNLIAQLNVLENIMVPLFYQDDPPADGEGRARRLAERMGLGDRLDHRPNELSGGQQQRVAISRSLVNDPDLILADEATGNLDSQTAKEILDLFDELSAEGKTIVFVTHEAQVAARASHVLRMLDGRIEDVIEQRPRVLAI